MRWWLGLVPLLAGCDYVLRVSHLDPADARPGPIGDGAQPLDAGPCAGTLVGYSGGKGLIHVCIPEQPPKDEYELPDNFDTGLDANCDQLGDQTDHTSVCVITAHTITISQNIDLKGPRPIVLAAIDRVLVHGNLFVGARATGSQGPGSNHMNCKSGTGRDGDATEGGGGGAGGSFGDLGGKGGDALNSGANPIAATPTLDGIRGGCAGGDGGRSNTHTGGNASGGASGGAVYIAAGVNIDLAATINASGAGGQGGDPAAFDSGGGGGGGAGGMIALDAPSITIGGTPFLIANGGGGGGGGGETSGNSGGDPIADATHYNVAALGGGAVLGGAGGGSGGASSHPRGYAGGSSNKDGGGGGGGSVGYILYYTSGAMPNAMASPVPYFNQ